MQRGWVCLAGGRARLLQLDRVEAVVALVRRCCRAAVAALLPLPLGEGARHVIADNVDVVAHARLRGAHLSQRWCGMGRGCNIDKGV